MNSSSDTGCTYSTLGSHRSSAGKRLGIESDKSRYVSWLQPARLSHSKLIQLNGAPNGVRVGGFRFESQELTFRDRPGLPTMREPAYRNRRSLRHRRWSFMV